jgi:hypothetical protein
LVPALIGTELLFEIPSLCYIYLLDLGVFLLLLLNTLVKISLLHVYSVVYSWVESELSCRIVANFRTSVIASGFWLPDLKQRLVSLGTCG